MDRSVALLAALGLAAALYLATQEADASVYQGEGASPDPNDPYEPEDFMTTQPGQADAPQGDPLAAFTAVIRDLEANGLYNVIYGGRIFPSYADHPRIKVWFYDPRRPGPKGVVNNWTDAAGAYQFISRTWDPIAARLGLTDFSPASQDAAAIDLLTRLGVVRLLEAGNPEAAFLRASGTWASLPGSTAGQGAKTITQAMNLFNANMVA